MIDLPLIVTLFTRIITTTLKVSITIAISEVSRNTDERSVEHRPAKRRREEVENGTNYARGHSKSSSGDRLKSRISTSATNAALGQPYRQTGVFPTPPLPIPLLATSTTTSNGMAPNNGTVINAGTVNRAQQAHKVGHAEREPGREQHEDQDNDKGLSEERGYERRQREEREHRRELREDQEHRREQRQDREPGRRQRDERRREIEEEQVPESPVDSTRGQTSKDIEISDEKEEEAFYSSSEVQRFVDHELEKVKQYYRQRFRGLHERIEQHEQQHHEDQEIIKSLQTRLQDVQSQYADLRNSLQAHSSREPRDAIESFCRQRPTISHPPIGRHVPLLPSYRSVSLLPVKAGTQHRSLPIVKSTSGGHLQHSHSRTTPESGTARFVRWR